MPNTAQLKFKLTDGTLSIVPAQAGIYGLIGVFKRGPVLDAGRLFTSFEEFQKLHGEVSMDYPDTIQVKEALEKGAQLRVVNVKKQTAATKAAQQDDIQDGTDTLFSLAAKYAGASYNDMEVVISDATNGDSDAFNLAINYVDGDGVDRSELYENLIITGTPDVAGSDYLDAIANNSQLVEVTYEDLSGLTAPVRPDNATITYANGTDATVDAEIATADSTITEGANEIFALEVKYPGKVYNDMIVSIGPASNGNAEYFKLTITLVDGTIDLTEVYDNIIIPGKPTVSESSYLSEVAANSKLVNVVYKDLSGVAFTAPIVPQTTTVSYSGGTDGTAPAAADFVPALSVFDGYEDIWGITAPLIENNAFNVALGSYADNRKDIRGMVYIGKSEDESVLIGRRESTLIDSKYVDFYGGSYEIPNPVANASQPYIEISPMGGILAIAGSSDAEYGPWYSFAGQNRGVIKGSTGVQYNFGTQAKIAQLNQLANRQINMVINRAGRVMLSGNFTGQLKSSQTSYTSIMKCVTFIERSLKPTIEVFIEDPLDLKLMRDMYAVVKPFFNDLESEDKRALQRPGGWQWDGDQDAASLADLKVNNANDVGLGKYKAKLFIKPINSLQEMEIEIILTPAGVTLSLV